MKSNKAKWQEAAKQKKEEIVELIKNTAEEYKENPENLAEFLQFSSKFYNYSTNNRMLIYKQNHGAMFCASYLEWQKKGYSVKKGEQGLKILVPTPKIFLSIDGEYISLDDATREEKAAYQRGEIEGKRIMHYKVGNVFDIGQTDCPVNEYPKIIGIGYSSEQHKGIFAGLKDFSESFLNCKVNVCSLSSVGLRGQYNINNNAISINELFDDSARLSTLSHELGHAILHNGLSGPEISPAQKEFEADAVSILVASYFSIDIPESRKAHLAENFKCLKAEIEGKYGVGTVDFNKMLKPCFAKFQGNIENIQKCVEKHIGEKELTVSQKEFQRDLIQQKSSEPVTISVEPEGIKAAIDIPSAEIEI